MYQINIQQAADKALAPKPALLRQWAKSALKKQIANADVTIRMVDLDEMIELNSTYRHKNYPTNVLSFPFESPDNIEMPIPILGDIVICSNVVNREAIEQAKPQNAHWAHMIVHGIFHLLGYDHENDQDAEIMEALEIETLQSLGFANPYETGENLTHHD